LEQFKKLIQDLNISDEEKAAIFSQLKAVEKSIAVAEFKYQRTLFDKAAIKNVLNASIEEIEAQKKNIEAAKNEINRNLVELDAQKKLIEEKNAELSNALANLKETQSQLIQSEKMASLGELTAGIAHEIQNPLNFVNNFSDINAELIEEMKEAINKGDWEEVKALAEDISANEQKINFHGKRADGIVKGMLQHSRINTDIKESVNMNVLADEYLRLAYHGLRAKDKSFNAAMKTDFDESIGNIMIIQQDIGRAILNLFTNAFYTVTEKKKQLAKGFEPTITVSTKNLGNKIEIRVKDNGGGIPQKVIDKIFQPFFTTKPTGQGTGLGLSLSYDIIKKHGGELKVETAEGEGSTFIIHLPVA
jgi:two-component system, NtrC family, sensor kinase